MDEKTLKQVCNLFFETVHIPLSICQQDGSLLYWLPQSQNPPESSAMNRALIEKHDQRATAQSIPFVEITDSTFYLAVIKLRNGNYFLLGPTAPAHYEEHDLQRFAALCQIPKEQQPQYCELLRRIPVYSFRAFLSIVSLLNFTFNDTILSPEEILLHHQTQLTNTNETLTHTLFQARETHVVHTPASYENFILQAVVDGDVIKLRQALLTPFTGEAGKMSNEPIQQEKFTFISLATLVTRAAISGGLNPELAYSLSDIYCQAVDKSHDIQDISKLAMEMCLDFTEKVAAAQGKSDLSPEIATCCEYISIHLHEEIDLQQLAAQTRPGPKALSKKFKNETGISVINYIHRERMKEARSLLEYSDYSIAEIGYYLQYNSQSYFSTIFKKFNGITPKQYRDQVKITRLH